MKPFSAGGALLGDSRCDGTVDVSTAYHRVRVGLDAMPYLCFQWQGQLYRFYGRFARLGHGPTGLYCGQGSLPSASCATWDPGPPLFGRSDTAATMREALALG